MHKSPERRTRVREICALMRSLRWTSDRAEDLAAKWGVTVAAVKRYAAEASQLVQEDVSQDPEMRGLAAAALRKIIEECDTVAKLYGPQKTASGKRDRQHEHPQVVINALRVKAEVIKSMAQLLGLEMPQQHEVRHINEALEREHQELFDRLQRHLPADVFQQIVAALTAVDTEGVGVREGSEATGKQPN